VRALRKVGRTLGALLLIAGPVAARPLPAGATGSVEGRVADDSGAPLPGATVEARGPAPESVRVAATDGFGRYRLAELPAGTYSVTFRLAGFAGAVRNGVAVLEGGVARVDTTLLLSISADVVVTGRPALRPPADSGENLLGVASASSEGVVGAERLDRRPMARAGDVLETIPGMVVTQHSGEGKANQYFLRGFDLDHGTDFSTTVAGMPVNLPTHAHGQGYTDLNFVIPELIRGIRYRKGPYSAEDGDFATAGSAAVDYLDGLDGTIARADGGSFGYGRAVLAGSPKVGGGTLLYGLEAAYDDGPWVRGDRARKFNGVLRYVGGDERNGFAVTGMAYRAAWDSSDQIPLRAVSDGALPRFGSVDPSDGGEAHRYSLSGEYRRSDGASETRASAYAIDSSLELWSDFTYFLEHPDTGDQFEQVDRRRVYGGEVARRWFADLFGRTGENEVGFQARFDDVGKIGLYRTERRAILSTTREDAVREASGAIYFQNETPWTRSFRTVVGVRGDLYHFDVTAIRDPVNGGSATRGIFSPKLSLIFGPFGGTEIYANAGYGFHSNDARGVTLGVDPETGLRARRVTPLARAEAAEVGVRCLPLPGWQTTVSLWALDIASELVFSGDAGTTEASRPSRRYGVEWSNSFRVRPWLTLDADVALSHARFRDGSSAGAFIPGAPRSVVSAGFSVEGIAGFFGSLRVRYFGPRPLVEDGSVRSEASSAVNALVGYEILRGVRARVELFNLLDAKVSDVDYAYRSRLPGEPAEGVEDLHFHPAAPRSARFGLSYAF
jgi:TonB dependent receptor/Carboxypeptidase regulatory-like domain/TonB-dependent Receptor Plug Domain